MRIYIAGPMTIKPFYNAPAFIEAQERWRANGYDAVTPLEANSQVWQRHYGRDFDPFTDKCDYGDPLIGEMFAEDVAYLCAADGIALLPGWEKSRGVSRELPIALLLGKPIYDAETFKEISLTVEIVFREAHLGCSRCVGPAVSCHNS